MPKEPPVLRFMLKYPVNGDELGPRIAQLAREGITEVGFEVIEDIKTFAKKTVHEVAAGEFLKAWIADHPTFKATEACRYFEANGRSKSSAYPALSELVEEKILKKLSPGNYTRADVKHIAPPPKKRHAVSNGDYILRNAKRSHGRFNTTRIKELFEKDGRNAGSVSPSINELLTKKMVKRVASGEYVLLQKSTPKPKTPPPTIRPNGPDVTAEVTNG